MRLVVAVAVPCAEAAVSGVVQFVTSILVVQVFRSSHSELYWLASRVPAQACARMVQAYALHCSSFAVVVYSSATAHWQGNWSHTRNRVVGILLAWPWRDTAHMGRAIFDRSSSEMSREKT